MVKYIVIIAAYFIGNISPAILISKARGGDIREQGSGNAGTTNVLRVYGKSAAVATLLIDILKGVAAVLLGRFAGGPDVSYMCAVAVIIGHIWPACYGFRGGKGVATGLGVVLAVSPLMGALAAVIAFSIMGITKMVSPGSIIAAASLPFLSIRLAPGFIPYSVVIVLIVIIKHRANISRLIKGEESKIKF